MASSFTSFETTTPAILTTGITLLLFGLLLSLVCKWLNHVYVYVWTQDLNKLPNRLLDIYVYLMTRGIPARHQTVRGQENIHKSRGKTFVVKHVLPFSSSIYTTDSANIRTAWTSNFDDWEVSPIRFPVVGDFVGHGITTTDKARWRYVRQIAKHMLGGDPALDFSLFKTVAHKYVDGIERNAASVELQQVLFDMYWESCFVFLMGRQMTDDDIKRMGCTVTQGRMLLDLGMRTSKRRSSLGPLKFLCAREDWSKSRQFAERFTDFTADEAYAWLNDTSIDHSHPLDLIRRYAVAFPDRKEMKSEILHFMIGTHSTVPGTLTHICLLLARKPEIWQKLHAEAKQANLNRSAVPDFSDLKLLDNVVREALRLHPPTPFASRVASRPTLLPHGSGPTGLDPLYVPAGTWLNANISALHRDPSIYGPDPDTFNPDRWNHIKPHQWDYMAFSRGRRICLGREKAMREVKYTLYLLVMRFGGIGVCEGTKTAEGMSGMPLSCRVVLTPAEAE